MPGSQVRYPGDGTTKTFSVPFTYVNKSHVRVQVDAVTVPFTWINPQLVSLATAPAANTVVEVRRLTPNANSLVDFVDGSTLTEMDLDGSATQFLYLSQEAKDLADSSLKEDLRGNYDALQRRITRASDPIDPTDVVNRRWAETSMTSQLAIATAAKASAEADRIAAQAARLASESALGSISLTSVTATRGTRVRPIADHVANKVDPRNHGAGQLIVGAGVTYAQALINTRAINSAIAFAKQEGLHEIDMPPGTVVVCRDPALPLDGVPETATAVFVYQAFNLKLRGNQTRLLFWGETRANYGSHVLFYECQGSCGLSGDWVFDMEDAKLPHVQGKIVSYTGGILTLDLEWDPGFSDVQIGHVYVNNLWQNYFLTPPSGTYTPGSPLTKVSGLRYTLNLNTLGAGSTIPYPGTLTAGTRVLLLHTTYSGAAISAYYCETLVVPSTVSIYASAGAGIRGIGTRTLLTAPNLDVKPGSGRLMSVPADGIHGCGAGVDSVISGRLFRSGDDLVNIYGYVTGVSSRDNANQLTVGLRYPYVPPRVGDIYEVLDANRQRIVSFRATSVTLLLGLYQIGTDTTLPVGVNSTCELSYRTTGERAKISDIQMGANRGRGVLANLCNPEIDDIDAVDIPGAVILCTSFGSQEFASIRNLTIKNISAIRCNYVPFGDSSPAIIMITPLKADGNLPLVGTILKVTIDGLLVEDTNNGAVLVMGADIVSVHNTTTHGLGQRAQDIYGLTGGYFVGLVNSSNVLVAHCRNLGSVPAKIEATGTASLFAAHGSFNIIAGASLPLLSVEKLCAAAGQTRTLEVAPGGELLEVFTGNAGGVRIALVAGVGKNPAVQFTRAGVGTKYITMNAAGALVVSSNLDGSSPSGTLG